MLNQQNNSILKMAETLRQGKAHQSFNPDPLQPTAHFLDHASRDVRRHFCILTDVEGETFFLRPDFTLPICVHYTQNQPHQPQRFFYHGNVWLWNSKTAKRQQQNQMGIEYIGQANQTQTLADVISATYESLKIINVKNPLLRMGNPTLFDSLIDGLDLPELWQTRLKKHFRRNAGLDLFFQQAQQTMQRNKNKPNIPNIQSIDEFYAFLQKHNISHIGQRRPEEILERISEQNALYADNLPAQTMQIIRDFLNLKETPCNQALDNIQAFAKHYQQNLDLEISEISKQCDAMKKTSLAEIFDNNQAVFSTHFQGAHLNYYTDFVFAFLSSPQASLPLAGGGRYDGLMRQLGVEMGTGVGATIYLDELHYG